MVKLSKDKLDEKQKRILEILEIRGPSLPVQIAKQAAISPLFAGAYLSELANSGLIKISNMKVGSSPLYLLPGQESMLDKFTSYLNEKEREALSLLKEKSILKDSELQPAIRVALRSIKDFAIPKTENNEITWRYFIVEEQKSDKTEKPKKDIEKEEKEEPKKISAEELKQQAEKRIEESIMQEEVTEDSKLKEMEQQLIEKQNELEKIKQQMQKKKKSKKRVSAKEKFLQETKQMLSQKNIQLSNIISYDAKQIIAKIKEEDKETLIFIYNKKKITEKDIIKAHKKAGPQPFIMFSKGNSSKKLQDTINACKKLISLKSLE